MGSNNDELGPDEPNPASFGWVPRKAAPLGEYNQESRMRRAFDEIINPRVGVVAEEDQLLVAQDATDDLYEHYGTISSDEEYATGENVILVAGSYTDILDEINDPTVFYQEVDHPADVEEVKELKREKYVESLKVAVDRIYSESEKMDQVERGTYEDELSEVKEALENREFRKAEELIAH